MSRVVYDKDRYDKPGQTNFQDEVKSSMHLFANSDEETIELSDSEEEGATHVDSNAVFKKQHQHQEISKALTKIAQFKSKISALEKDRNASLYASKQGPSNAFSELQTSDRSLTKQRLIEEKQQKKELLHISSLVHRFKNEINHMKSTPTFLEKIKILMDDIESSIMKFKERQHQGFEELVAGEQLLQSEIHHFENRFNAWSIASSSSAARVPSAVTVSKANADHGGPTPPEVQLFEKYLVQTGGHYGGWDSVDHQLFVKLQKQVKSGAFMEVALSELPTRSEDDIGQHVEWWKEYLILRENKRKAIIKWKNMKQFERDAKVSKADQDLLQDNHQKRRHSELVEQERMERFSKLDDWKTEKERRQKQNAEALEREKHASANRKKEDLERKRMEAKEKVADYSARKQEEKEIERFLEEARKLREMEERKVTEEDKRRIQERDTMLLMKRQATMKAKQIEKEEREKRLSKLKSTVEVHTKRDPSRLLQPTAGWLNRKHAVENAAATGPSLHMPRRAVPTWRQHMT